jgi:hypothetical protein
MSHFSLPTNAPLLNVKFINFAINILLHLLQCNSILIVNFINYTFNKGASIGKEKCEDKSDFHFFGFMLCL